MERALAFSSKTGDAMRKPSICAMILAASPGMGLGICHAQSSCASIIEAESRVSDIEPAVRLAYIESNLQRAQRNTNIWAWSWVGALGLYGAGQIGFVFIIEDKGRRCSFTVL